MRELSIFVDESGDFGKFERHSPFYIFTLVFHKQIDSIEKQLKHLENDLRNLGLPENHCFHIGPLLRREEDYVDLSMDERRKVFNKIIAFTRKIDIKYVTFFVEKKDDMNVVGLTSKLSRQLHDFLNNNMLYFSAFDKIILYYDNGQMELGKLLAANLSWLPDIEYRKVQPASYRLFQVADLICTLKLVELKRLNNMISRTETEFFGNMRDYRKNYLKPIQKKEFNE